MKFKRVILLLLCYTNSFACYCQSNKYEFSHISYTNGLSNNHITSIYKDGEGFMWFGTQSGLNRYDGYKIKQYRHDQQDSASLADNYIDQLFEAPDGNLWVVTREGRFNIYDASTGRFDHNHRAYLKKWKLPYDAMLATITKGKNSFWFLFPDSGIYRSTPDGNVLSVKHKQNDDGSIAANKICDLKKNAKGDIWIIHEDGMLEKIGGQHGKVEYRTAILQKQLGNGPKSYNLFVDAQDGIWIYSGGVINGAYYFNPTTEGLKHLSQEGRDWRITSNYVYNITQDEKGLIWIATDHGGVNILDKKDSTIKNIVHSEADSKTLPENSIITLLRDNLNIIWLGSSKSGISYYHENVIKFTQYKHQPFNPISLSYDDINSFAEDIHGNLWIGSNGGGIIYFNRRNNTFKQYLHNAQNTASLCNNVITSLLVDSQNKLWIGTYFGGLDCYDGKTFTHFKHNDTVPGSLADNRAMSLFEDSQGLLWIATFNQGLDKLNPAKKTFTHYKNNVSNSVRNGFVTCMAEDPQKNLWVGTANGIDVLEIKTGKSTHYSKEGNALSNNNVICLLRDKAGNMWAGTREGINIFEPAKKKFHSVKTEDGLTDNYIRCIVEDNHKDIWVTTSNGVSKIRLQSKNAEGWTLAFKNYDEQDGLQAREFNDRSGLKLASGEIAIGGPNGFNIFAPAHMPKNNKIPSVIFTDLQLFNQSVQAGVKVDGRIILSQAISKTKEITLDYNHNVLSIEFASLTYTNTNKNKYAYMMEGFNKTWLATEPGGRTATYTNLDPGEYTFRVKASNADGVWNEKGIELKIIIRPPFWKTPLAYLLYILVLAAGFYFSRRIGLKRVNMRFMLEQERQEAKLSREMDAMKIRFFTNMSHELRTPLSLIISPIEKLLDTPALSNPKSQYELIQRNAKRLLNLVNQLLDFRKLEVNELKLHVIQGDVLKFIKDTAASFTDLGETKNIDFNFHCAPISLHTKFDHDKIERILFNLLSNAFKFTPENGEVSVNVRVANKQASKVLLEIKVCDNGIGIPPDKQEKIFERFFQSPTPSTILNQGSGIGLAITKEFVKMHNGSIAVESEPNKGSCFTLLLPFAEIMESSVELITNSHLKNAANATAILQQQTITAGIKQQAPIPNIPDKKKKTLLIVEDNEDFRFYVKDNLSIYYNIIEAADGKEGWQKALALHPDVVVSDINMPIMDGIVLCKKIKTDQRTQQIPVILLTALTGEGQELKGLETGASDYLTKPFNFEILLSKVRNLLDYKETIKKTYQKQVQVTQAGIEMESEDDKLIRSVLGLIEKNMDNPDFSVEQLSRELHFSRATLYKKLLSLTGKSPVEFIRHVRLIRAAELLEKSQMTISEIAYNVGFNSPKYFAQYFKAAFDIVPTAYRVQKKQKQDVNN